MRRNGPNSTEIPAPHSALRCQHSPSSISHGRPGSASALAFRQQSPVLPVFPGLKRHQFHVHPLLHLWAASPQPGACGKGERWAQWIRSGRREESDCSSLFREWFSAQPSSRLFFFPQLIPLKKVINIQNILAQITSYTLTASAPTKLMPVCIH